jgi:hypothetical protein
LCVGVGVEFEEKRDLSKKSISELQRYFSQLIDYIKEMNLINISGF